MLFRHTRWLVVLATTGLASFAAKAQTPQTPLGPLVIPPSPLFPASGAVERPQGLPFPAGPGAQPGPGAGPYLLDLGPSAEVDGGRLGIAPPPATPSEQALAALSAFRVEPGRHLLEFRGSGIHGPYHDESDRWLDFGILVQAEYLYNSPSSGNGPATEQLFFRRLRPSILGGMGDWQGIIELDFGAGQNGTSYSTTVRWVNFQYTGFYQAHATFGSFKPWFSRELLTLGPHLQTIERSPVGDTNYGNPDYMIGFAWDQMLPNRKLLYYASVGLEDHQQSVTQMQMRSPANAASGANQGVLVTGRLDYYLFGEMPYDPRPLHTPPQVAYNRGDFHTDAWRAIVSTGLYGWWNDNNSNPYTVNGASTSTTNADLERAFGVEVSGGVRGFGLSADVEYQHIRGDLVVGNFTGGLYVNGRTNMDKFSVTGGYMLPGDVEVVGAWAVVGATGFERPLTETKVGVNWYVMKYAVRFSATQSFINNNNGTPGYNVSVTRADAQFVW
jgi:hypothetical protein